jgi:nitrogen fixation protein FixH
MTRSFTGRHMAAIMIAFFGVIVAVNILMATFAVSTFGGKVVDNSYVAGQRFNFWLREARAQQALGWDCTVTREEDGRVAVRLRDQGRQPLRDARIEGVASHPVGRAEDVPVRFSTEGDGRFVSDRPLPEGRWYLHLTVTRGGDTLRVIETVR